jgi:hypothetical protein
MSFFVPAYILTKKLPEEDHKAQKTLKTCMIRQVPSLLSSKGEKTGQN